MALTKSQWARSVETVAPDVARGVRAALATLVPYYLAKRTGSYELVWMALGGWLGTLADAGGARSSRAKTLIAFASLGALTVIASESLATHHLFGLLFLIAVAFSSSLVRALGAAAATIGTLVVVVATIAVFAPGPSPLRDGAGFAIGGAWAVILSSIVWPIWTHLPVRRSLAAAWKAMAAYADAIALLTSENVPHGDERWAQIAREHQRQARAAIEEARAVALASRARRAGESALGSNLRALLGLAETQLVLLVAYAEEVESLEPLVRQDVAPSLKTLSVTYTTIGETLETRVLGSAHDPSESGRGGASVPPPASSRRNGPLHASLARRLIDASEEALVVARSPSRRFDHADPTEDQAVGRLLADDLQALVDAMSIKSTYFRHALRVSIAMTGAAIMGPWISPHHPHWIPVTTVVVLQPYPGATVTRGFERVLGTVLGSLVAVVVMKTVHHPIWLVLVMFPLSVAAVATRARSYRLFTFFLTPVFVLLADAGHDDWWNAAARAGDVAIGGLFALLAAMVFPSRENKRLAEALSTVLSTLDAYGKIVLDSLFEPAPEQVILARRANATALGDAETSLERLMAERIPGANDVDRAEDAMLMVTHARRLSTALTALDSDVARNTNPTPPREIANMVGAYLTEAIATAGVALDGFTDKPARTGQEQATSTAHDAIVPHYEDLSPGLARVVRRGEVLASVAAHRRNKKIDGDE